MLARRARPPSRSGRRSGLLPLVRGGEFARRLEDCREAALALHTALARDARFVAALSAGARHRRLGGARATASRNPRRRAQEIFDEAARAGLHLALAELPTAFFGDPWGAGGTVTALRSVLMKPEHRDALPGILKLLSDSTG